MSNVDIYTKGRVDTLLDAKVTKPTVDIGGSTGRTASTEVTIQMLSDWGIITINDLDA